VMPLVTAARAGSSSCRSCRPSAPLSRRGTWVLPAPRPMAADRPDRPVPILRQHPCRQPERGGDAIRRDAASLRKGRELGPPGPRSPISATERQPIECMMISVARWTPARPWATRVEPVGAPGYAGWDWPWAVAVLRRCRSIGTTHPSVPSRRPCPVELRRRRRFTRYNPGEHVERMQIQLTARRALSPVARGQIEGGRTRV